MLFRDAVRDYLNYIKVEKGLAKTTQAGYQSWLHGFERFLSNGGGAGPDPTLHDFTTPILRRYLYEMSENKLRPRTIWSAFFPLRGLGEFLVEAGALEKNPCTPIKLPKKDAAIRLTVSDAEIQRLLDAVERQTNAQKVSLDRAWLYTLVFGGLRRQELIDLKVGDVILERKCLLIANGKGGKSRELYICDELVEALEDLLRVRNPRCRHDYLFALDTNRRLGEDGLRERLEDIKAIAGLMGAENIKPHSLRHACATRAMRGGMPIKDIQTFLGHSSLAVTSVYLHTDEHQLQSVRNLTSLKNAGTTKDAGKGSRFKVVRLSA